jgi:hypothetical protein
LLDRLTANPGHPQTPAALQASRGNGRDQPRLGATFRAGGRIQDLRLAVRALCATPIVTAVAILSLGLGIGANTAIFSLVNSLLLRTLPVADPQRLVSVSTGPARTQQIVSHSTLDQIRQHG